MKIRVITIDQQQIFYAKGLVERLSDEGIEVDTDFGTEKVAAKVRTAILDQTLDNYIVIGEKEVDTGFVNIRNTKNPINDLWQVTVDSFLKKLVK